MSVRALGLGPRKTGRPFGIEKFTQRPKRTLLPRRMHRFVGKGNARTTAPRISRNIIQRTCHGLPPKPRSCHPKSRGNEAAADMVIPVITGMPRMICARIMACGVNSQPRFYTRSWPCWRPPPDRIWPTRSPTSKNMRERLPKRLVATDKEKWLLKHYERRAAGAFQVTAVVRSCTTK